MAKFKVEVVRVSYATRYIEVEADSEEEAKDLAIDEAGSLSFSEHSADYEVESTTKISE